MTIIILHGGDGTGVSKYGLNPELQQFIDSGVGATLSLLMHTVGIFVFLGGLGFAGFRIWRSSQQHHYGRKDLEVSRMLIWGGLLLNGLGGFMRLAMSDHPTLADAATNTWVQLILSKHVLWFALFGITYVLSAHALPQMVEAAQTAVDMTRRAKTYAYALIGLTLAISILGGAASTVGPGPATDEEPDGMPSPGPGPAPSAQSRTLYFNGTITGTPVAPGSIEYPISVPADSTSLTVTLQWSGTASTLEAALADPDGADAGPFQGTGTQLSIEITDPAGGDWKLVISSTQANQEAYRAVAVIDYVSTSS